MDTGYRKLDVLIYWSGSGCDRDHPQLCKRRLKIVNYYKPSGS
jgi:hypothetical protein